MDLPSAAATWYALRNEKPGATLHEVRDRAAMLIVDSYKDIDRGKSLKAEVAIIFPSTGITVHGCKYFVSEKGRFVKFPERSVKVGDEYEYVPIIEFNSTKSEKGFIAQAIKAIDTYLADQDRDDSGGSDW